MNNRDAWMTPARDFAAICNICAGCYDFLPELDVAANKANNLGMPRYYTDQGLTHAWDAPWFCNPPYSAKMQWTAKACDTEHPGALLMPANTLEQPWFHALPQKVDLWIRRGRIAFEPPEGLEASQPRSGNVLVIFSPLAKGVWRRW